MGAEAAGLARAIRTEVKVNTDKESMLISSLAGSQMSVLVVRILVDSDTLLEGRDASPLL